MYEFIQIFRKLNYVGFCFWCCGPTNPFIISLMKSTFERTWVSRRRANTLVSTATSLLPDGLFHRRYNRPSVAGEAEGGGSVKGKGWITHFFSFFFFLFKTVCKWWLKRGGRKKERKCLIIGINMEEWIGREGGRVI